jgi:peptidoglycan hydrolase CwlO-like protein
VLILLAFLFLASTTLAVLFYVRNDESVKGLSEEKTKSSKLAKESSEKTADINKLVKIIVGRIVSREAATEEANQRLASLKIKYGTKYGNLSSAIAGLSKDISDLKSQIKQAKSVNDERRNEIAQKEKAIGDIEQGLKEQMQTLRDELTAAKKLYEKGLDNYKVEVDNANKEFQVILKQRDRRIDALDAKLGDKAMEMQQLQAQIARLQKIIRDVKGKAGSVGEWLVTKPSGKVAKVLLDQEICYINLGEKDRVTAGLAFSIFSAQTGVPKDGKPKAKIVIVNVGATTSECRIVESKKDDSIVEGDLIVNLVFSSTRTYNFVVEGEFDLYGTGRADPLANRHVRAMIERFGGKVADEISISTDFVVMGDEPPRPPKPAEDAPPAVWKIYNERMKAYNYYKQVKATAVSLQIPVLNTNRFLAYSGHVPKKRLVD